MQPYDQVGNSNIYNYETLNGKAGKSCRTSGKTNKTGGNLILT